VRGTSATKILFEIATDSALLAEKPAEHYRSTVEKLLYLSKRVRLNKFTAIAFLGTRVQSAVVQDWEMLRRGIRYIDCLNDASICLEARRSEVVLE
jgi:hypothetical protein